ncbi:type I restriction-modification system subunit M N-terminal domain-containing protein, partial [Nostoc sp.]
MAATSDIVQKLWKLCDVLRDDGVTYLQYVTELTYLLFLKMAQETGAEKQLPEGYRWGDLVNKGETEQLIFYRSLLLM